MKKTVPVIFLMFMFHISTVHCQGIGWADVFNPIKNQILSQIPELKSFNSGGQFYVQHQTENNQIRIEIGHGFSDPDFEIHNEDYPKVYRVFGLNKNLNSAHVPMTQYVISGRVQIDLGEKGPKEIDFTIVENWNGGGFSTTKHTTIYTYSSEEAKSFKSFGSYVYPKVTIISANMDMASVPISGIRDFVRKRKTEAAKKKTEQQKNANNSSSNSSSSGPVLTISSQNKSTASSQGATNTGSTSTSSNKREVTSGKTYQQMEYERQVYQKQQQEKMQNAVDPTRKAMQPVKDYFDAQIDKINREREEKNAHEEREWLARQRRKEQERIENERLDREYQQKKEAQRRESEERLTNNYKAKGGDANFKQKEQEFIAFAKQNMAVINSGLKYYDDFTYQLSPTDNCSYVEVIDGIMLSKMPFSLKKKYIYILINVRYEYQSFLNDNSRNPEYASGGSIACANYLDIIADGESKYTDRHRGKRFGHQDDSYLYNSNENWNRPHTYYGVYNKVKVGHEYDFNAAIRREADIEIRIPKNLMKRFYDNTESTIYNSFHVKPINWSKSYDWYKSRDLFEKKSALTDKLEIQKEMERYIKLYRARKKYMLNGVDDDRRLAIFYYNMGQYKEALNSYKTFVFNLFGSFDNMILELKNSTGESRRAFMDYPGRPFYKTDQIIIWLGAILYTENEEYEDALKLLDAYEGAYTALGIEPTNHIEKPIIDWTTKLKEDIYFKTEQWNKIAIPQNPKKFYGDGTYATYALMKKGDLKTAKKMFDRTYKRTKDRGYYYAIKAKTEAFQELAAKLYPKNGTNIKLNNTGYTFHQLFANNMDIYNDLAVNTSNTPSSYLKTGTVDVNNASKWYLDHNNPSTTKEDIENNFAVCTQLYNSGKFENEESVEFLTYFIQKGIILFKVYDIIPALLDLQNISQTEDVQFQADLVHYFIDYSKNEDGFEDYEGKYSKTLKERSKTPEAQSLLHNYLTSWAKLNMTSPRIPYMYTLVEDSKITSGSNKQNGVQTTSDGFIQTNSGLKYKIIHKGEGKQAENGKTVSVHYTGQLPDGKVFDSSYPHKEPIKFLLGQGNVIKGWDEGIALLKEGDKARFVIPPHLGFGSSGSRGVIPPNATLIFDVELMEVK